MPDLLDAVRKATTCPFCQTKFSGVVKLIPDCGSFLCGACYDDLRKRTDDESQDYSCKACDGTHVLPQTELLVCRQILDLLGHPIEKPLSDQAKKLKFLVESVREELAKLEAFDPRDHIEQTCLQLEHEVSQAAQSAVEHIKEIESELVQQIHDYRHRCLSSLTQESSLPNSQPTNTELATLTEEINAFSDKWNDYFNQLNSLASESEVEAAISRTGFFQAVIRTLDQETKNMALGATSMQFTPKFSFYAERDHLGELAETPVPVNQTTSKKIRIKEDSSVRLSGHFLGTSQVTFLPDGRLASCSRDQTIKVWDPATGFELFTLNGHASYIYSIALMPNGWLASCSFDKTIKLWDLEEKEVVRTLSGHTGWIVSLKVLNSGNLVSFSWDDTIRIWNPYLTANNLLLTITGHGARIWKMPYGILSNDFLVACSRHADDNNEGNTTMRVWDLKDGTLVKSLLTKLKSVATLAVLSNDQVAIGTGTGTIKVIDLKDQSKTRTRERAHASKVTCLLQLSNGNLVSGGEDSSDSYSLKVWNSLNFILLQSVKTDHSATIYSLCASRDETLLASGSDDQTIKLWPITSINTDSV